MMLRVKSILRKAHTRLSAQAAEREIDDELLFHIEMRTQENVASGMTHGAAREDAVRRFGDLAQIRAACRKADKEARPGLKALKLLLFWVVVGIGVLLRLDASVRGMKPMGDLLVMIAIFTRLLIYVRHTQLNRHITSRQR